jgi:hypothetical protein
MKRRSVLAAFGVGVSGVAGCSTAPAGQTEATKTGSPTPDTSTTDHRTSCGDETWNPSVAVDDVALAPGERATFDVHVGPIASFNFERDLYSCGTSDPPVQFGDVDIEPDPDRQADSCPPYWIWDECTTVQLGVPVEASADAEPGEYEYGFSLSDGGDDGDSSAYRETVVVSES